MNDGTLASGKKIKYEKTVEQELIGTTNQYMKLKMVSSNITPTILF